jgi:hypothetical protein
LEQIITIEDVDVLCINLDDGLGWRVENPKRQPARDLIRSGRLVVENGDQIVDPAQYGLT